MIKLTVEIESLRSSQSDVVTKSESKITQSPISNSTTNNNQLETLQKEYDEKLSQKKEIEEYIENQLPAVTAQINQLNDEHTKVSSNLEKTKLQLETLQKEYDEKLSQKKEIEEYIENQLPAVTAQINQLNDEYAKVSSDLNTAKSELNTLK